MRRVSRFVGCGLFGSSLIALACGFGSGAQAAPPTLGPLVQITQGDPFSTCTADQLNSQEKAFGSILFPGSAIEPWAAIDPTDATHILIAHQQDRWDDGGARGNAGNLSTDSGSTWSDSTPSGVTECTGGNFGRSSDPWVTFAPDGTAFFFSLVLDPAQPQTPFGARNSGVLVSRSTDGAQTWSAPTALIRNKQPHVLNDKNSITADPTEGGAGHVYAVWDQLSVFPLTGEAAQLLAENDGVAIARKLLNSTAGASSVCEPFTKPPCKGGAPSFKFGFTGPTMLSLTTDNGDTWSLAKPIYAPGVDAQTINNIVQVLPNGHVLDFFTAVNVTPAILNIGFIQTTDKGTNWGLPSFATDIQVVGVVTPDSGEPVRDASILYSVAVDQNSGAIYLAWQDDRFSTANCTTPTGTIPVDGIVFSQSLDGGATWSTPVQINQTPANANACRQQAFIPAVVVAGDGTIVVTYYDFRKDTNTPTGFEATDYFAVFCTAGCSTAGNWGNEVQLTTSSFNILDAPVARGHFLGDYMGLAASGKNVFPVFGQAVGTNLTAEFVREITLP